MKSLKENFDNLPRISTDSVAPNRKLYVNHQFSSKISALAKGQAQFIIVGDDGRLFLWRTTMNIIVFELSLKNGKIAEVNVAMDKSVCFNI